MAQVVEDRWSGPLSGLVITRYGHALPCRRIEVVEAAHPVPDENGLRAAQRLLSLAGSLTADDLALCLISGGGSSLLAAPAPGISLADKQALTSRLLRAGATIAEINCLRKHLSAVKGGRLALACTPAPVTSLIISDVPGDDPSVVASGPTVADAGTLAQAREVLARYEIEAPAPVLAHLSRPENETPKPGDARLAAARNIVIASARTALTAAADLAARHGVEAIMLGDDIQGEAREVGRRHAQLALQHRAIGKRPAVLLSGGETTVTVHHEGRGGRNTEYLLGLALELQGEPGVWALAADTDGVDGTEENAGALIAPDTLARAANRNLAAAACLEKNDAYRFFAALGSLVVTGPTYTNVNDFRAIYVE
jgi:hydroxypyruvate reductase